jgi:hypothetical protein
MNHVPSGPLIASLFGISYALRQSLLFFLLVAAAEGFKHILAHFVQLQPFIVGDALDVVGVASENGENRTRLRRRESSDKGCGIETPRLWATSLGGTPLYKSFLADSIRYDKHEVLRTEPDLWSLKEKRPKIALSIVIVKLIRKLRWCPRLLPPAHAAAIMLNFELPVDPLYR